MIYRLRLALFVALHLACFAAIWTGVSTTSAVLCAVLYAVRMFGVTAGYHRYFSHRTYKLGRVPQFLMAFLAQSSAQKSVLWWAAHHRHHHRHSDKPTDIHSPRQSGFWYSHVGWILDDATNEVDLQRVKDLAKYPEIMFLHRYDLLPPLLLAIACFLIDGWTGLVVGFLWSTVLCWHATFTINSLSHVFGSRRYETKDDSRNNWILALITFGEGWHNNHHHYQASVRQGFKWWEIDISYYGVKLLSWIGIASDLREPPKHVVQNRPHPALEAAAARAHAVKAHAAEAVDDAIQRLPRPAPAEA